MDVKVALKRIVAAWVLLLILVALLGKVSVAETNNGRTAADFLLIGQGARAAGMGGAFTALSEGAEATYWNPAGLADIEGGEVTFGHFAWFQDITIEHGAFAYRLGEKTTGAASITYLNYGTIEGYDINGSPLGDISAYDYAAALSLGYQVSDRVAFGLTGKFVGQNLDGVGGSSVAADIGAKYAADRYAVAAFVGNIGPNMTFENVDEKLPSLARLGVLVYPFGRSLVTAIEAERQFLGATILRQGVEFNYDQQYYLRTGFSYYPGDEDREFGSGFTVGAGLRYNVVEIDYAFTPERDYSSRDIHRFSVVFKFGH